MNHTSSPIEIKFIDYGKAKVIEGDADKIYLEQDYIRTIGKVIFEQPKEEDEYVVEENSYDYDITIPKKSVVSIQCKWAIADKVWKTWMSFLDGESLSFMFDTKKEAHDFYDKILEWYFQNNS